jgi:glycosyltransferase involved in cell wall biosynthesis
LFGVRRVGFVARSVYWFVFVFRAVRLAHRAHRSRPFQIVYGYEVHGVAAAKVLSRLWHVPLVARFQGTTFGVAWLDVRGKYLRAWDHWVALRAKADLVIMTDDGTRGDRVLASLGQDMSKVRFWMNGTDKGSFRDLPSRAEARGRLHLDAGSVLLMVSRLERWKCVERGIHAMPRVLEELPNTTLVIVGEGSDKNRLMRLARSLRVADRVLFAGSVVHEDIPLYMAAADLFLSLYRWSNVGNPLLEAMLAGTCIVTLANGDTARVVKNGVTGLLLDEEKLEALPELVLSLLRDPARAAKLGAAARAYALDTFPSWEERLADEIREVSRLVSAA